jgi:hypothetical protein
MPLQLPVVDTEIEAFEEVVCVHPSPEMLTVSGPEPEPPPEPEEPQTALAAASFA